VSARPHGLIAHAHHHACDRAQGAAAIKDPADYEAIARTAPFLTELSLKLPASATALPQQMATLLSACSKLVDLALHAYDEGQYMVPVSSLVDVDALLSVGTQLLHLKLPGCTSLTNLAPLRGLVNLQSLDIRSYKVSDLTPLGALVNLQRLDMSCCYEVSDLAPLAAMLKLQSLDISGCHEVRDLAPLGALVSLQSLDMYYCHEVSDLAPLGALMKLQKLSLSKGDEDKVAPLHNRVDSGELLVVYN
jgi:hypothetical protein